MPPQCVYFVVVVGWGGGKDYLLISIAHFLESLKSGCSRDTTYPDTVTKTKWVILCWEGSCQSDYRSSLKIRPYGDQLQQLSGQQHISTRCVSDTMFSCWSDTAQEAVSAPKNLTMWKKHRTGPLCSDSHVKSESLPLDFPRLNQNHRFSFQKSTKHYTTINLDYSPIAEETPGARAMHRKRKEDYRYSSIETQAAVSQENPSYIASFTFICPDTF